MHYILIVFSLLLIITVILSWIRNDYWVFKMMEYPRYQKLILFSILIVCWVSLYRDYTGFPLYVFCAIVICWCYLLYKVFPYTRIYPKEVKTVKSNDSKDQLKVFAANVLQDNTEYDSMLKQAQQSDADLIYLMETNGAWYKALQPIKQTHPHFLEQPLENTYGLLFYSKLPLHNARVNFLVKDDIPSVEAEVKLPSGKVVKLWGLHPEPPVPGESLTSTAKDKELMKVALEAKDHELPVVVMGDLNDVAWSYTTELFRATSKLLDPRRGRGFYSTFSAHHFFIKYPLDYIFCSSDFGLISMKRLPKNGSDHYATLTHLALMPKLEAEQDREEPTQEELSDAKEIASQGVED